MTHKKFQPMGGGRGGNGATASVGTLLDKNPTNVAEAPEWSRSITVHLNPLTKGH